MSRRVSAALESVPGRAVAGVAYMTVLLLVSAALVMQSQGAFHKSFTVTTTLSSVGDGLPVGSDVKLRGLIVGRVGEIQASPGRHVVRLDLKPEFASQIPASVQTRVLPTNLFGAPYLDLRPAGAEMPALVPGASIPQDTSRESVQLQTVFKKVYDVLVAVDPAKLSVTLAAIADALRGNGERIGQMIEQADAYLSTLNQHADTFRQDLTLLANTLEGVDQASPDLLQALKNTASVARVIVEERNGLRKLLAAGISSADSAGDFVRVNGGRIVRVVGLTAQVADIVAPVSPQIARTLEAVRLITTKLPTIVHPGFGLLIAAQLFIGRLPTYSNADCPRYPGLAGPNCTGPGATRPSADVEPVYGGSVANVGSPEDKRTLGLVLNPREPDKAIDLASLLLGPALRGTTVAIP